MRSHTRVLLGAFVGAALAGCGTRVVKPFVQEADAAVEAAADAEPAADAAVGQDAAVGNVPAGCGVRGALCCRGPAGARRCVVGALCTGTYCE